jgi:sarcosine oxidase subunit beta
MKSAEVVIIGGGIQGISLAYHLARRGLRDTCLLEMKMLGSGSSGKSASVIGHAFQSEACLPLTRWSYQALMDFEEQVGVNPGFEPIGCLLLADGRGAVDLRHRHLLLESLDVESHLADAELMDHLTPGLRAGPPFHHDGLCG